jgi:hypothetical protein
MNVLEPDVTFTDYALAVECTVLSAWVVRRGSPADPLRVWLTIFFATLGLAALTGGTVHGFFPDERSLGFRILWSITLLAIGGTAVSAWAIGARLVLHERPADRLIATAAAVFAGYAVLVLFVTQSFALAIAHYAPSALFLLSAFAVRYARTRAPHLGLGASAVALMLIAAALQRLAVAPHPVYFNHNALYHAIQALALLLLYHGARPLIHPPTMGG